jgi:hypothetical protein
MLLIADIEGIPQLGLELDRMQQAIAGPIAREALQAGGNILADAARANIHSITGALAADVVVQIALFRENYQSYALIGPGWDAGNFRRVAKNRRGIPQADQTTNPGVYGYFVEVGHRAPGLGLAHNAQFQLDYRQARKQGRRLDTFSNPSSRAYGHLDTPPHPWLMPAAAAEGGAAVDAVRDVFVNRIHGGQFMGVAV